MADESTTLGEQVLGRALQKEKRAGVLHYVTGQHQAKVLDDTTPLIVAELTFVNVMGHACIMPCRKIGDKWEPFPAYRVVGLSFDFGLSKVPYDYELSEAGLAALEAACG